MRFLLVDQILELESGQRAVGIKNVAMTEDFLNHHFPGTPIMPGALIAEATLQLANWLVREATDFRKSGLPAHMERARFQEIVRPGDQLVMEVVVLDTSDEHMRFKSTVRRLGKRVASGRFTLDLVDTEDLASQEVIRNLYETLTIRLNEGDGASR